MTLSLNLGLLILRVVCGLTLAAHGAQKCLGWFGGPGWAGWTQNMQKQGFKPAPLWTALVVLGELGGGLSLATGFLTPLGAAGIFSAMFMAIFKSHWKNGFWNGKRGIEFPLSLLTIAIALGFTGPGAYAFDALFGLALPTPLLFIILAAAGAIVDIIGLIITRPPVAAPAEAQKPTSA